MLVHMSGDSPDRLKVHRRELMLDGEHFTVLSPRAQTEVRFSTNHFHETWHVISDVDSARFLGRVLWAMAYQLISIERSALLNEQSTPVARLGH